jgi:hypothetical protein
MNQVVGLYYILYDVHAIEDDLGAVLLNLVACIIPKLADVQTSDADAKLALANVGP